MVAQYTYGLSFEPGYRKSRETCFSLILLQGTTTHKHSPETVITPMTGTITRALNWDNVYEQQFIAVTPMGDEVLLYQTNHEDPGIESNSMLKLYSRSGFENIQCSSYSDINKGIVGGVYQW